MHVELSPCDDLAGLGAEWSALEARSEGSFFTSWNWVGTWLTLLPSTVRPFVMRIRDGQHLVGLGIVNRRWRLHGGCIPSRVCLLHETGDLELDELTIEHNGLLLERGCEHRAANAAFAFFERKLWFDELQLNGLEQTSPLVAEAARPRGGLRCDIVRQTPLYTVDLRALRASGADYLAQLSSNSRAQIRKALRLYEQSARLTVRAAETVSEGLEFFQEMKLLHNAHWNARGKPGSFAHPFCDAFHRRLIETRLPGGSIQLLRISVPGEPIGYLYHFLYRGRVLSYQSGFAYADNSRLKPGLVSHVLAVEWNLSRGADVYDFLAGDQRYKASLSTQCGQMVWLRLRRPRLRFLLEDQLRHWKGRLLPSAPTAAPDEPAERVVAEKPASRAVPSTPDLQAVP